MRNFLILMFSNIAFLTEKVNVYGINTPCTNTMTNVRRAKMCVFIMKYIF